MIHLWHKPAYRLLRSLLVVVIAIVSSGNVYANGVNHRVQNAMVKIYTAASVPDYFRPWTRRPPAQSSGSGVIIAGQRIITNAHVVSHAVFIQVRRNGQGKRYRARTVHVVHDADIAVLSVDDTEFFTGVEPVEFGALPAAQSDVLVYGYPKGGDALSVTKGVVNRIENSVYVHSGLYLLSGQIDAAINPGNSGGPVVQDGRLVGVVMQNHPKAQSQGFMVPVTVLNRVFADLEDGRFDGFPTLGILTQSLENPAMRAHYDLPAALGGALVVDVPLESSSTNQLFEGDVILEVAGYPIGDDGKVVFRDSERTGWQHLVQAQMVGSSIALKILRDKKQVVVQVPLTHDLHAGRRVSRVRHDAVPRYFVYGGLVFAPLSGNLLQQFGKNWRKDAPGKLIYLLDYENDTDDAVREWVILQSVLAADVNRGYHTAQYLLIDAVNGVKLRNLEHLVALIEETKSERVVFTTDLGFKIVINTELAKKSHEAILTRYRISADRVL